MQHSTVLSRGIVKRKVGSKITSVHASFHNYFGHVRHPVDRQTYSSLSHLRDCPVDVVNVDRSFVELVMIRPDIAAIVRAITNLCGSLGLQFVTERIETPEQKTSLVAKGCALGRGDLFGRPVPAPEVSGLMTAGSVDA